MATTLTTDLPTMIMSSQIGYLDFSTSEERLEITLEDSIKEIFRVTLYAYDGKLTLSNLREVIENYMVKQGEPFIAFTLFYKKPDGTIIGDKSLWVVYCSVVNNANIALFGTYNFLTTLSVKRVPRGANERLALFTGQDNGFVFAHCVYATPTGDISNVTISLQKLIPEDIGVISIDVKYIYIRDLILDKGLDVDKILSYTIQFQDRYFTYYVTDQEPCLSFTFKNCFNVDEIAYIYAITTTKTKVNRSLAISCGEHLFYDQSVDKAYDVESASLTADEADWIEQLFYSHSVRLGVSDDITSLPKVIITESTCEIADNDESLNKVKFTWQFAEKSPHLQKSFRQNLNDKVFTEQYNATFK